MVLTRTADEVSKDSLSGFKEQNVHNVSVARSTVNGLKVQQKKPKDPSLARFPYIISEKTGKMRCAGAPPEESRKSALQLQYPRRNDARPQSTVGAPHSGTSSVQAQVEKPRRCPLRIAELAEPSKRHCIETWRQRSNILPEFMLERLKRQVMNQKVIAQIPDAVECFKMKAPKKKTPPCAQKCVQQGKRHTVDESMILTEARNLSAIFAHQIATRLFKSQITCAKPSTGPLSELCNVVINELNQLFSKKRKFPEICYDNTILEEMSMKITMWMLDIMKDADQKLIEDQLRAKKCAEYQFCNDDALVTLINTYFHQSKKNSKDLEEDVGPALDAIDTILSNVMSTCVSKSEVSSKQFEVRDESSKDIDENTESNASIQDNISDLANLETKQTFEDIDLPSTSDQDELIESGSKYESISDDDVDVPTENVNNEDVDTNVSEVIVALEESLDERKTVTFTNVDNGPGGAGGLGGEGEGGRDSNGADGHGGTGETEPGPGIKLAAQNGKRNEEGLHSLDSSSFRLKKALSEISFRPPNESLLSLADEYWPNDLNYGYLKSSASMSKSMVSLPNIQETDECYDTHESSSVLSKDIKAFIYNLINEETTALTEHDTSSKFMVINDMVDELTTTTQNTEDYSENENAQQLEEVVSQQPSEANVPACTVESCDKNAGKGDHLTNRDQTVDRPDSNQDLITVHNPLDDKNKVNYRVCTKNAPSWVCCSPSEESIQNMTKKKPKKNLVPEKMAKCDLRRWCADMEQTVGNLKEWNRWLDITSKKVLIMKQQSDVDHIFSDEDRSNDLKEWVKLKRSIDRDALLWRKLNCRTLDVLKNYYDPYGPLIENDNQCGVIVPKKTIQRQSLMETLYTIEGLSLWLHRSIVSTENCLKCNCSKLMKRSRTSPESLTEIQPSCSTSIYYKKKVNRDEDESLKGNEQML